MLYQLMDIYFEKTILIIINISFPLRQTTKSSWFFFSLGKKSLEQDTTQWRFHFSLAGIWVLLASIAASIFDAGVKVFLGKSIKCF